MQGHRSNFRLDRGIHIYRRKFSLILSFSLLLVVDVVCIDCLFPITHLIKHLSLSLDWVIWVLRKYCVVRISRHIIWWWVNFIWHYLLYLLVFKTIQISDSLVLGGAFGWRHSLVFITINALFRKSVLLLDLSVLVAHVCWHLWFISRVLYLASRGNIPTFNLLDVWQI